MVSAKNNLVVGSVFLNLRLAFAYLLLPVYLFALVISPNLNESKLLWSFVIIHLLLYPAGNGYLSYFNNLQKVSRVTTKSPSPVNKLLFLTALLLEAAAILLGWHFINTGFAAMLFLYGLIFKMYYHPAVRLKKYPIADWVIVALFQGAFAFLICYVGINNFTGANLLRVRVLLPALLSTLMLLAFYPPTQVWQNEENSSWGVLRQKSGLRSTVVPAFILLALVAVAFVLYFKMYFSFKHALVYMLTLIPVALFLSWSYKIYSNPEEVNNKRITWLSGLTATCLNAFFTWLFLDTSHLLQL
ncbi:MAG: ubiquinone biosynthesis protein UbiA [Cyclobacteriaceae bacterium]|nr:ubiquinone biosynthesis protein UbiA [Cyclobacteriaceae bacterium]